MKTLRIVTKPSEIPCFTSLAMKLGGEFKELGMIPIIQAFCSERILI